MLYLIKGYVGYVGSGVRLNWEAVSKLGKAGAKLAT